MLLDKKFFLIILINAVVQYFVLQKGNFLLDIKRSIDSAFYTALMLIVIYFILDFLLRIFNKSRIYIYIYNTIKWVLLLCTMIIGLIVIFLMKNFGTNAVSGVLDIILATNKSEVLEFIHFYATKDNITLIIVYILVCAIFLKIKDFSIRIQIKPAVFIFIISFIISAYILISDAHRNNEIKTTRLVERIFTTKFIRSIIVSAIENKNFIKEYQSQTAKLDSNLSQYAKDYITSNNSSIPNVVLIIGESVQRNFMHIYGYNLQNTPHLDALQKNGNLFVFSDTIAPGPNTQSSLQKVLTFSDYENQNTPWYKFMNIIDAMKMAGYKSIWFSNQPTIDAYGNVASVIGNRANFIFHASLGNYASLVLDSKLLDLYDKYAYLMDKSNKNLYIFHLIQSHIDYKDRFPKEYAKFNPSDIDSNIYHLSKDKSERQKNLQIIADYVNSIYYDDYILNEIIERFKDKNAIIFYFSDHGQDIFQTGFFVGHKLSKYGLEVPFMIYVSPKFKAQYPQKVELIKNALNKPFMMDDFIHGFLSILDIKTKDNIESKDIFSDKFDVKRERIVGDLKYENEK